MTETEYNKICNEIRAAVVKYHEWLPDADHSVILEETVPDDYYRAKHRFLAHVVKVNAEFKEDEYRVFPYSTYQEILHLNENNRQYPLSHHTEGVINDVSKLLNIEHQSFIPHYRYPEDTIARCIVLKLKPYQITNSEKENLIKEAMRKFGYFSIGDTEERFDKSGKVYVMQFEPYYYENR